jgi:hypothetical protein
MVKLYQDGNGGKMELIGGKLSSRYIEDFLSSSYDKSAPEEIGDFVKDKKLSGQRVQVYHNPKTGQAVVVHRGSQGIHDWGNNLKMALGFSMGDTKRFSHGKKIQKEAEAKYGAKNISTLGHSLGGKIASDVGKDSGEIITLNKPVVGRDLFKKNQGKKENETNIRTGHDVVSALDKNADFTIPSKSINTIAEHTTSVLDRTDKDFGKSAVGGASFSRKDISKLKKKEIKDIIKSLPKIKDGFKLVGKGKPELVNYLCSRTIEKKK